MNRFLGLATSLMRRQKAEGRGQKVLLRSEFNPLGNSSNQIKDLVGVLNLCFLRSRQRLGVRIPFCLLPPALCLSLIVFSTFSIPASAVPTRTVYAEDISKSDISLKVTRGYGLTINFMATGETIKQVWIGDITRYSFTSNGNLCAKNQDDCQPSPATVIFLRQIKPIAFPNMTSSADGSTTITILTDTRQYQFKLIAASGQPEYTSLVVLPQSEKPLPLLVPSNESTVATTPPISSQQMLTINRSTKPVGTTLQRDDANALAYGLTVARQQGQIKFNSSTWRKAQDAIRLLRQGKDRQTAITKSGISAELFNQLIQTGKL